MKRKAPDWCICLPQGFQTSAQAQNLSASSHLQRRASNLICMRMSQGMDVRECCEHWHCHICLFCVPIMMSATVKGGGEGHLSQRSGSCWA